MDGSKTRSLVEREKYNGKDESRVNVSSESGLAMRPSARVCLVLYNGSPAAFVDVCEKIEVDVGDLVKVKPIFVVDKASNALVIG